ncbi:MAG TPA: type I-U CRISPR-associated protein Csb2, partial [Pirellulales bacterium]
YSPTARSHEAPARPFAAFQVLNPNGDGFRPFDAASNAAKLAGMARHAVAQAARASWGDEDLVNRYVLGHGEARGAAHVNVGLSRFAFLPLPSLEARGKGKGRTVSAVRRLLIADLSGAGVREIGWAERAISGAELVPERRESCPPDGKNPNAAAPEAGEPESGESALKGAGPVAVLTSLGRSDDAVRRYTEAATTWTTVTPMLLPGFDDPRHLRRRMSREGASLSAADKQRLVAQLDERVENLIRKSIVHAGFPEALARGASIEWRKTGYLPGVELADRYFVPVKHRGYPRWHVNLTWRDASGEPLPLPGPLALGAGKFYGLGLFVGTDRM